MGTCSPPQSLRLLFPDLNYIFIQFILPLYSLFVMLFLLCVPFFQHGSQKITKKRPPCRSRWSFSSLLCIGTAHLSPTHLHGRALHNQLRPGAPAAHGKSSLVLLPSGPDTVQKLPLRRTRPSALIHADQTPHKMGLGQEFNPVIADYGLQGTATSPSSAILQL